MSIEHVIVDDVCLCAGAWWVSEQ